MLSARNTGSTSLSAVTRVRNGKRKNFASVEHLNPEAVAAFVDAELDPKAMHRARVHLVHCPQCRDEVARQRAAHDDLALLKTADTALRVPAALLAKLADIEITGTCGDNTDLPLRDTGHRALVDKVDLVYRAIRRSTRGL